MHASSKPSTKPALPGKSRNAPTKGLTAKDNAQLNRYVERFNQAVRQRNPGRA